jgi:hypothetical protein
MRYIGEYKNNIFNGQGTLQADKSLYKGEFTDG